MIYAWNDLDTPTECAYIIHQNNNLERLLENEDR